MPESSLSLAIVGERAPGEAGGLAVAAECIAKHARARGARVQFVCWSKQAAPGARVITDFDGMVLHQVGPLFQPVDALGSLGSPPVQTPALHAPRRLPVLR